MSESTELEYLVDAWNAGISDYPITVDRILNATSDFAIDFFFKCFNIYRRLLFPEEDELCAPEEKRLPMAVKFINQILNGKYKVGYFDILRPNRTRAFCFRFALNFILHSIRVMPQLKSLETEVRSQIVSINDEIQSNKTELNQLCVKREILSDKINARRQEYETVSEEHNKFKQQLSDFQVEERNSKESIHQLSTLIAKKQEILQKLEASTKEKSKLYSCISNWDKLLNEFNRLEEEKKHFEEFDVSVSEALQEKHKCIQHFESIIETLQTLKGPLEHFATNYPTLKETYDNQMKQYNEKLKQLETSEADIQKLIAGINIDNSALTKSNDKIAKMKNCLSELDKKKFALLKRNEELNRDNDYNIKIFVNSMKECEALELEMQTRYNNGIRVFEDISKRFNSNVEKISKALRLNLVN